MSSLIITKQTGNFFSLVLDGGSPIISEQNRLTTVGNFCNFKTANGANLILKQNILYSDITIVTGVSHVPTSINDLWISLLDAGFFDGLATTGGSSTIDKFTELLDTFSSYIGRDGQLLVVNESEQKIETIAISLFSEDDRTKLDGIETGAQVNVQSDVNETNPDSPAYIKNFPDLGLGYTAEDVANKVSVITGYDVDLYPNEKATHDALDLKLNISDLPTNLTLYPTTTTSDVIGYVVMVKDIHDVRYNSTAVDVSTPTITGVGQLVSQRISDAGVLIGQPGVFNITTFGNIRHLSGSGSATFYFEVYHRDDAGVETLICTSSTSEPVVDGGYSEFTASGLWNDGDFVATDRIVIKSYANRIAGGSDPVYQFQFGGASPVRTLLPVPFSVVDAGYELKSNKSSSLTPSDDLYPNNNAVLNALPVNYSKIVYVNATSPITATIFDTENPPVTNDNLLKNDVANLYIGTDASTWVYNSTTYVTKTVTATSSNFYLAGTTTDAGNTKTGHITRSGPVTLTGSLNMAIAKISTTPNTSAGSYDILTRNSSTTALEKKLVSDFLQTTGNQNFTGSKTGTSTDATPTILTLTNSNTTTGFYAVGLTNSATASTNGSSAILLNNDNTGSNTSAIQLRNNSTGLGLFLKNLSSGIGTYFENWSTGVGFQYDSRTGSTGDLIRLTKNTATTTSINHLGEINTMTPTVSTQVATKGYTDAKITQTITNGVTDKSPSEDAVYDALANVTRSFVIDNIPSTTVTGTLSETILKGYFVPANTFSSTGNFKIPEFSVVKGGTAGALNIRIYVNTSNTLTGAVQIARYTATSTNVYIKIRRSYNIYAGNIYGLGFTVTNMTNDITATSGTMDNTAYNVSNAYYIITTATLSSTGDSATQTSFEITN